MDPEAFNYSPDAEESDSSCYYFPGCTDDICRILYARF